MLREFAPAKINLYLHITGRRPDGYHILDSLTAFAGVGDEIRLEPAPQFDFVVEGPQAARLRDEPTQNNLVVRVATELAQRTKKPLDLRITLIKNLPVASGIGGGSSDAAAALRALAFHWGVSPSDASINEVAALCGQDVPVCLGGESCYIVADGVAAGPEPPHANIVLVNPGKVLPTAEVYKIYKSNSRNFSLPARLETTPNDLSDLIAALKQRGNDLAAPALQLMPEIGVVLAALEGSENCLLARMSGSGATCFGFYPDRGAARNAAANILAAHPDWWVIHSYIPHHRDRRQNF